MRRKQCGARRRVQLLRIVQQHHIRVLGERISGRIRLRRKGFQCRVPFAGERVPDLLAAQQQGGQRSRIRVERGRPLRRVPVDLGAHRQRARVSEHDVAVRDVTGQQRQPRAERQVVDDDVVRTDLVHHRQHPAGGGHRVPEQVRAAGIRLVQQRLDHAPLGGREEPAQRVVLAPHLIVGPDHPGVRATAEPQIRCARIRTPR